MAKKDFPPVHPGEILSEDFLKPLGITASRLSTMINVDRRRITDVIKGKRSITVDTAMRFARVFNTTPDFWLNLQKDYDIECAYEDDWTIIRNTIKPLHKSSKTANMYAHRRSH